MSRDQVLRGFVLGLERFRNLRPDAVLVNLPLKKIAIMDLTRPYDGGDGQTDHAPLAVQPRAEVSSDGEAALLRPDKGGDVCSPVLPMAAASGRSVAPHWEG